MAKYVFKKVTGQALEVPQKDLGVTIILSAILACSALLPFLRLFSSAHDCAAVSEQLDSCYLSSLAII